MSKFSSGPSVRNQAIAATKYVRTHLSSFLSLLNSGSFLTVPEYLSLSYLHVPSYLPQTRISFALLGNAHRPPLLINIEFEVASLKDQPIVRSDCFINVSDSRVYPLKSQLFKGKYHASQL